MSALLRIVLGLFLFAHGGVHTLMAFLPSPEEEGSPVGAFWTGSWLLDGLGAPTVKRLLIIVNFVITGIYVAAGLSWLGIILPVDWWQALVFAATVVSLATFVVFWDSWLKYGVAIDLAILAAVFFLNEPLTTLLTGG